MANTETYHLNQTLKDISQSLKEQNRVLVALNSNLLSLVKALTPPEVILAENLKAVWTETAVGRIVEAPE